MVTRELLIEHLEVSAYLLTVEDRSRPVSALDLLRSATVYDFEGALHSYGEEGMTPAERIKADESLLVLLGVTAVNAGIAKWCWLRGSLAEAEGMIAIAVDNSEGSELPRVDVLPLDPPWIRDNVEIEILDEPPDISDYATKVAGCLFLPPPKRRRFFDTLSWKAAYDE